MSSVAVNPPKTPVTKGSSGIAAATIPNVCKMPGPPAPFVPTPLPNIGRSGMSPSGYTTSVKVEGEAVAIKGASFGSMGDVASKGTGGGLVSCNVEGPTKFLGPGSMDVKFEGKNVQLLSDPMLNNNGPSGSPANSATMSGVLQDLSVVQVSSDSEKAIRCAIKDCDKKDAQGTSYPKMSCQKLGTAKHACVAKKLKGKEPAIFSETFVVMKPSPKMVLSNTRVNAAGSAVPSNIWEGIRLAEAESKQEFQPRTGMIRRPDTIFRDASGQLKIIDAKFPCSGDPAWSRGQLRDYKKIAGRGNVKPVQPSDVADDECA